MKDLKLSFGSNLLFLFSFSITDNKNMMGKYLKIILFNVILVFCAVAVFGQRSNGLIVEGKVSAEQGSVDGAIIQMYQDGKRLDNYGIPSGGRYKVELNYNHEFVLIFSRKDNFSQKIVVSTAVPQKVLQSDPLFPPFPVDVNLFTEIPGIDKRFSENTVLKIFYSQNVDNFISEVYYNDAQIKKMIDQAIAQSQVIGKEADYLSKLTKAELAELRKEYDGLLQSAEKDYSSEKFLDALDGYQAASRVFPKEQYPKDRIAEINDLLGLQMVAEDMAKARAERLDLLLKQADLQYSQLKYTEAKSSYNRALSIAPTNQHALQRVAEITDLQKRQQTEQEYQSLIALADNAVKELLYEEALNKYKEALQLKQNESYPQQKIREINETLSKQAQSLEKQASYKQAIFQAEALVEKQFYDKAIASYENALSYKPGDELATRKIEEIKNLMQRLANQSLYDKYIKSADKSFDKERFAEALTDYKKAQELLPDEAYPGKQIDIISQVLNKEQNFADRIKEADLAFNAQQFSESRNLYNQALEIHNDDKHALDRLKEIETILAGQQTDERYNGLVAEADNLLSQKNYDAAIAKYNDALAVKSKESYPKEKIAEINSILQGIAQANQKYEQTISKADNLFADNKFTEARAVYTEAGAMKPAEAYPKEMLAKIEAAVQEQARALAEQQAAEQKRQEELALQKDNKYQQTVDEADRLVKEDELIAAVGKFREALEIKPQEQYPIVRIEEIRGMISRRQEAQKAYEEAIAAGRQSI